MSDTNAPEPTMEEILASIRRIISEDDAPAPAAGEAAASPGDPPSPPVAPPAAHPHDGHAHHAHPHEPHPAEDVLELTERVEPEPASKPEAKELAPSLGDLDFAPASAPASASPPPRQETKPAAPPPAAHAPPAAKPAADEPLVGAGTAGRAADHFGALASSVAMPPAGRTLEDVTRELLRPLLKEWLDQNLAAIVEARVQDEVERISRRRSY